MNSETESPVPVPPPLPPSVVTMIGTISPSSGSMLTPSSSASAIVLTSSSSASSSSSSSSTSTSPDDRSFSVHLHDQFDSVYNRATKGRHDLKTIRAYLAARVETEKMYSAKLQKDAGSTIELTDSSSCNQCWKDVVSNAVSLGKQHEQFATTCNEIMATLDKLIIEVKNTKTSLQARYKKVCEDVKVKTTRHDKSKQIYYDSVKAAETALLNRGTGRQQNLPDKTIAKLEDKARSTLRDVAIQHENYKKSVDILQEAQTNYDASIVDIMAQFERLERQRFDILHKQLERYAVAHDFLKSAVEQMALLLHKSVAAVNIPRDVQEFIKAHDAGTKPKPHVEYIPLKSQIIEHEAETKANSIATPGAGANGMGGMGMNGMGGNGAMSGPAVGVSASGAVVRGSAPPPPLPSSMNQSSSSASSATIKLTAIALYDFETTEADDLPFKQGDVINLVNCDDAEDWWQGELGDRTGIFPKNYVEKQAPTIVPAAAAAASAPPPLPPAMQSNFSASPSASAPPMSAAPPSNAPGGPAPPSAPNGSGAPAGEGAEQPKLMDAKCKALYDFEGQDADELSFKGGQTLIITGELNGWYLGRVEVMRSHHTTQHNQSINQSITSIQYNLMQQHQIRSDHNTHHVRPRLLALVSLTCTHFISSRSFLTVETTVLI